MHLSSQALIKRFPIGESQSTIRLKANPSVDVVTVLSSQKLRTPKGGGYLRFVLRCNASAPLTAKEHSGGLDQVLGATIYSSSVRCCLPAIPPQVKMLVLLLGDDRSTSARGRFPFAY